jgi:outer membrane protein OmpA-like peptidoglycan-associated protein
MQRRSVMRLKPVFLLPVAAAFWAAPVFAQDPAYTAEDIIKFFEKTRGICVGTKEECEPSEAGKGSTGFDLAVTFNHNSAELTDEAMRNLDQFSNALQDDRFAAAKFAVEGFTDASGSENYNLSLSERRAGSVVAYLAQKGVDKSKLSPFGYGETKPKADDPLAPENRRVETRLIRE